MPPMYMNAFSGKSFEVFRPLQPPVKTGGRNFKAVILHVLDDKQPRKVVADCSTVINIHAADFVDEYPHQPAMVGKLNIDQHQVVPQKYGIRSIPTLLVFKGGQVVGQIVGAVPRAKLEDEIKKHV